MRSQRRSSSCRRGASPVEHRGSSHNNLGSGAQARGLVAITRCRTSSDGINAARVEVGAGAQEDRVVAIRRHQVRGVGVAQARWSRDLGAGRIAWQSWWCSGQSWMCRLHAPPHASPRAAARLARLAPALSHASPPSRPHEQPWGRAEGRHPHRVCGRGAVARLAPMPPHT